MSRIVGDGVHLGFLHVLLVDHDINDDEDVYGTFEHIYRDLCFRTSEYMRQYPASFNKNKTHRCLWYWGYFTVSNLSRVLNTDDLPHLEGCREGSDFVDFISSFNYLISITPLAPQYSLDPFFSVCYWTWFQRSIPLLKPVFQEHCQIDWFVERFAFCTLV